jgi:DNA modification methylase
MIFPPVAILQGDALQVLRALPDESVQCCVTSPPYWGLRDYGVDAQIGLERTPEEYLARIVAVCREVRRVLRADGTLWLNLGDCYATGAGKVDKCPGGGKQGERWKGYRGAHDTGKHKYISDAVGPTTQPNRLPLPGLKPKDLVGIPWLVAFALRADGWYLRQDLIWAKPNCMPESVRDRCTRSHEYIFLLTKSKRYYYDSDAVREPSTSGPSDRRKMLESRERTGSKYRVGEPGSPLLAANPTTNIGKKRAVGGFPRDEATRVRGSGNKRRKLGDGSNGRLNTHLGYGVPWEGQLTRNRRSVWFVASQAYKGAHFATFPAKLVEPCVLAGSKPGDVVLDCFCGAGTVGLVATKYGRKFVGIELNPKYCRMARERIFDANPHLTARIYSPAARLSSGQKLLLP